MRRTSSRVGVERVRPRADHGPPLRIQDDIFSLAADLTCEQGDHVRRTSFRAKRDDAAVAVRSDDADPEGPISSAVRIFFVVT